MIRLCAPAHVRIISRSNNGYRPMPQPRLLDVEAAAIVLGPQ
jgi:hypothetical protein